MSTAFDATNAINLAETAAVACINGDSWLGNTSNVVTVHQKIRRTTDDPFELYLSSELPAIGVLAGQGGADDRFTMGEFEEVIRLGFDVWVAGGEFDAVDQTAKTIVARLRRLMRLQAFSPSVHAESNQLDTFLANGTIDNEEYDFEYFDASGSWLVHGVTYSLLTILSTE
jgi:hypothetical protein